jgi:hypothetical protein
MPFIRNIEELKQFVKMNKDREDYFNNIIEEIISHNQE